ncbi:hypothetical protein LIA77_04752 [Sarocladium implicatum]|nr:hypothetical protein LIA77_04752 [Sarocladium implicatum]
MVFTRCAWIPDTEPLALFAVSFSDIFHNFYLTPIISSLSATLVAFFFSISLINSSPTRLKVFFLLQS